MAEATTIFERTDDFIREYKRLKDLAEIPDNKELAAEIGIGSASTISNILGRRQNITPEAWKAFRDKYLPNMAHYGSGELRESQKLVPDPMEIIDRLSRAQENYSEGFRALVTVMERIEKEMARADAQARMETNLKRTLAAALTVAKGQEDGMKELRDLLSQVRAQKNSPSEDAGKGRNRIDEGFEKKGKNPA